MSKVLKKEHIKDIDFRKREVRQAAHINQFKEWYNHLAEQPYSEANQAQLSMLSAVLWHLLSKQDYKKLVTSKIDLAKTPEEDQLDIVDTLSWI